MHICPYMRSAWAVSIGWNREDTFYTIYIYMWLLSFSYDYSDNCLTGCLAYLIALVPLATVALMIGCNGRNHHCLLTALRSSLMNEFNILLLFLYIYIFSCICIYLLFSLIVWWPVGHSFCLSFEFLLITFIILVNKLRHQ